jgi:hypothetical protein
MRAALIDLTDGTLGPDEAAAFGAAGAVGVAPFVADVGATFASEVGATFGAIVGAPAGLAALFGRATARGAAFRARSAEAGAGGRVSAGRSARVRGTTIVLKV